MTMAVNIVLSVLLIAAGYVFVCCYLKQVGLKALDKNTLKITPVKLAYLIANVVAIGTLIAIFETVYSLDVIRQMKLLVLVTFLFPAAAIDFRVQKIPNQLLAAALLIRVLIYTAEFAISVPEAVDTLKDGVLGAVLIGGFFLLLLLVFKNSIGMGDIKLFAVMGLYQGMWGALNVVFFSLMVSFFLSVGLLITRKKSRKDTISFGPSILLGTIIAMALAGM